MAGNHKKPHPIRRERTEIRRERIDALELKDLSPEEIALIDNWIEADQNGNPEGKLQFAKEWRQLGRRVKDFDAVVNLRKRAKIAEETGTTSEEVETGLTLAPSDSRSLLHAEVKRDVDDKIEMLEELRLADLDVLDLVTPGERRVLALQTIGTKETLAWARALSANPNDGGATRAVEEFKKSLEDAEKIQRALAKQSCY